MSPRFWSRNHLAAPRVRSRNLLAAPRFERRTNDVEKFKAYLKKAGGDELESLVDDVIVPKADTFKPLLKMLLSGVAIDKADDDTLQPLLDMLCADVDFKSTAQAAGSGKMLVDWGCTSPGIEWRPFVPKAATLTTAPG